MIVWNDSSDITSCSCSHSSRDFHTSNRIWRPTIYISSMGISAEHEPHTSNRLYSSEIDFEIGASTIIHPEIWPAARILCAVKKE